MGAGSPTRSGLPWRELAGVEQVLAVDGGISEKMYPDGEWGPRITVSNGVKICIYVIPLNHSNQTENWNDFIPLTKHELERSHSKKKQ